jgi:hypothetical protein
MTVQIFNCEQGSPEWATARLGIPTASEFATVMAKGEGKTRRTYMHKLAGEILTGEPMENYTNANMERGKIMEDEARSAYEVLANVDCERVGFIRNGDKGCSPDSLLGATRGLEIKTALPHIQIERLVRNDLPPEHKAQVQGSLWVSERDEWDFVSYWPKLPMLQIRVQRDEEYIKQIAEAVDAFNAELHALVEKIRRYGQEPAAVARRPQFVPDHLMAG